MRLPKVKNPIPKDQRGRVYSTGNLVLLVLLSFISGWIIKGWIVEWWGFNVSFGQIFSDGCALLWEFIQDPDSETDLGTMFAVVGAALSGGLQLWLLWKKRKQT